ncbi:MAG: HD domain-containing protein [Sterolibacterium sp.]
MNSRIDCAVVIALPEEERCFLEVFSESHGSPSLKQLPARFFTFLDVHGSERRGALISLGAQGELRAAMYVERLLSQCSPQLVVSIGISGMLSSDIRIGDVVVPQRVDGYMFRARAQPPGRDLVGDRFELVWGGGEFPTSVRAWQALESVQRDRPHLIEEVEAKSGAEFDAAMRSTTKPMLISKGLVNEHVRLHIGGTTAGGPILSASSTFKKQLAKRNRNYLALDMESAAIAEVVSTRDPRPELVIVRGISDPGDEDKRFIEDTTRGKARDIAMRHASRVLRLVLSVTDFKWGQGNGQQRVTQTPQLHRPILVGIREVHSRIFEDVNVANAVEQLLVVVAPTGATPQECDVDRVNGLLQEVINASRTWALELVGRTGSGKTALLLALYVRARSLPSLPDGAHRPAVFVDLSRFASLDVPFDPSRHLKAELGIIDSCPKGRALLFVDGVSADRAAAERLARLIDSLRNFPDLRIVSASQVPIDKQKDVMKFISQVPEQTIRMNRTDVTDKVLNDLIRVFVNTRFQIDDRPDAFSLLEQAIRASQLDYVDILTLDVIAHGLDLREGTFQPLSRSIEMYLANEAHADIERLDEISASVFERHIVQAGQPLANTQNGRHAPDLQYWDHPIIRDFLVARRVSAALESMAGIRPRLDSDTGVLRFVYPNDINRYCKISLSTLTVAAKSKLLGSLTEAFAVESDDRTRAHISYLVGRLDLTNSSLAMDAQAFLADEKNKLVSSFQTDTRKWRKDTSRKEVERLQRRRRLLLRTLYISLVQTGDSSSGREYIDRLMTNVHEDTINRGFHLEYYGDIKYDPALDMSHVDNLKPFPRTYRELTRKLEAALDGRAKYSLFDIDIYTLFSLSQHRHAAGDLDQSTRLALLQLSDRVLKCFTWANKSLLGYLRMVQSHLSQEQFRPAQVLSELYGLKRTVRSGWVKRGRQVRNPESVADHTWGAICIALCFLPERLASDAIPCTGYNKDRIIRMLAIHDMAEARTGDLLDGEVPDKKTQEEAFFLELSAARTYLPFDRDMNPIDLWTEFEKRETINAHIAHDVDKLENLMQLQVYRKESDAIIPDYDVWVSGLIDEMGTDVGKRIAEVVLKA